MESSQATETKHDRIMWFSMWFLGAIASFGLVFFPLFYYSIERRNFHFKRQQEVERRIAAYQKKEWPSDVVSDRSSKLWAASIILVLPIFAIAYFLSKDLLLHEMRQKDFYSIFYPDLEYAPQTISIRNCSLITVATLGVGVIYWLYKIMNVYNNHFKAQQHIEYEIFRLMEAKSHVESV